MNLKKLIFNRIEGKFRGPWAYFLANKISLSETLFQGKDKINNCRTHCEVL